MIRAVLLDLDDTLYPHADFLDAAWDSVARAAARGGALPIAVRSALASIAAEGLDRGPVLDRALALAGETDLAVPPLVETFLTACPERLTPYPGAVEAIRTLRRRVPVGVVADGVPATQRAKLRALGLADAFDTVLLSDELGPDRRKPDAAPFLAAARALGVTPEDTVVVGDRPDEDVAGARAAGMRVVRIVAGEYADVPDDLDAGDRANSLRGAVALLQHQLPPPIRDIGPGAPRSTARSSGR